MCMLRQGCSLSILHRTCENMHEGVGLCGLGMPNILYKPFYFKTRGIEKYCIPCMMQIELTCISIKIWIFDCNVYGFFNCSGNAMVLPPYYLEVILCSGVASVAVMVVCRGGFL